MQSILSMDLGEALSILDADADVLLVREGDDPLAALRSLMERVANHQRERARASLDRAQAPATKGERNTRARATPHAARGPTCTHMHLQLKQPLSTVSKLHTYYHAASSSRCRRSSLLDLQGQRHTVVLGQVTGVQEPRHGSAVEGLNRGEAVSLSQSCVDAVFALEAAALEGGVSASAVGLEGAVSEGAACAASKKRPHSGAGQSFARRLAPPRPSTRTMPTLQMERPLRLPEGSSSLESILAQLLAAFVVLDARCPVDGQTITLQPGTGREDAHKTRAISADRIYGNFGMHSPTSCVFVAGESNMRRKDLLKG